MIVQYNQRDVTVFVTVVGVHGMIAKLVGFVRYMLYSQTMIVVAWKTFGGLVFLKKNVRDYFWGFDSGGCEYM